jgi:hypothetical protein
VLERDARRADPFRSRETKWAGALRPHRVYEQVASYRLDQHRGVTDYCEPQAVDAPLRRYLTAWYRRGPYLPLAEPPPQQPEETAIGARGDADRRIADRRKDPTAARQKSVYHSDNRPRPS